MALRSQRRAAPASATLRKTHRGGHPRSLVAAAQRVQSQREDADYDAWLVPRDDAEHVIELAETFVGAIERLLAD